MIVYLSVVRDLTPTQAGGLLAVQGVGAVTGNLIGGVISDRLGSRGGIRVGMASTAAALGGVWFAEDGAQLVVALLALGSASEVFRPGVQTYVAETVSADMHVRAFGLLHWGTNLTFPLAMAAAATAGEDHFGLLFLLDGATCAVFAAAAGFLPAPARLASGDSRAVDEPEQVLRVRRGSWRRLGAFAAVTAAVFTVLFQGEVAVPLSIIALGGGVAGVSLLAALNGLVVGLLQPLLALRLERMDLTRALSASYALTGVGIAATGLASSVTDIAVWVVVWSFGEIGVVALGSAWISRSAPPQALGRWLGIYGGATAAATIVAPLAGASLWASSETALWLACLILCLLAATVQVALQLASSSRAEPA